MKGGFHRRPRVIIAAAAVLYAAALFCTWVGGTENARRRTAEILENAGHSFAEVIYGEVDAVLRYMSGAVMNLLDGTCSAYSDGRMQEIGASLNIDEINVVDARTSRIIASNIPGLKGADFTSSELKRAFLVLTNGTSTSVTQPFRHGVDNPDMYCKYYGIPFPKRDGILQIGLSFDRLRQNMYNTTREESERALREWTFSIEGWYLRADDDPDFRDGGFFIRELEGKRVVGRYFRFFEFPYAAVIPESFGFRQRNAMFIVTALVLGALMAIFTCFLVWLARASVKLEELHRDAEARNAADVDLAGKIQMSALPSVSGVFLEELEFDIEAVSRPAKVVGGDFYDFYHLQGGRVAFLIADVSGKGISAAMFMMEAKSVIRNCLIEFNDLDRALDAANERLCTGNDAEMFVTAWVGLLDPATGALEYVNAGHNRPFLRHADGTVEKITGKGGPFLGMFDRRTYRSHSLTLRKGDRLFLYTDGIPEAMNARKEIFGEKRLVKALSANAVDSALKAFVGGAERSDDLTVLAVDWSGAPRSAERTFPCDESSLADAVDFIRKATDGIDRRSRSALLNAADEITSNIVNYSDSAEFVITVETASDRLRVRFIDAGVDYNPLLHVDPDTRASIEDRPIGGLGLVMVKRLVDRVSYERTGGRNVLTVIKRFSRA